MKIIVDWLLQFTGKDHSRAYKIISIFLGTALFLVILPGLFMVVGLWVRNHVPVTMNRTTELSAAILGTVLGLYILLWSAWTQWKIGNGTPTPTAPTQDLVVTGPYEYCRNPIELGAVFYYFGTGTFIGGIVAGAVACMLAFGLGSIYHKFIEEKELEKRFGEPYKRYRANTPFIFPRIRIGKYFPKRG